jgi:acyl-CoA synthetase (NDP forming)
VSQSGAYGSYLFMLAAKRGIGIGQWVTTGNEMDVAIADAIDHLSEDPTVSVIGCTAEGVREGEALLRALERAHGAGKPVVRAIMRVCASSSKVDYIPLTIFSVTFLASPSSIMVLSR